MIDIFVFGIAIIIAAELFLITLVLWLRSSCPWLITWLDRSPKIDPRGLDAFMEHGWDAELGWIRKPNTQHNETGRDGVQTSYHLDQNGARLNPGFENRAIDILAYGDSYTFARQVNDDETWPHLLSTQLDVNVANFGVGNYGLDQALLRLEREYEKYPAKIVIIGVVPETICRIHAVWKHFSEYGNTFAFKPRFILNGSQLELFRNVINTRDKYSRIEEYYDTLAQHDYFYHRKFCRDLFTFPFTFSLIRNWQRNSTLILKALADRLNITKDAAFISVMNRNIDMTVELFDCPECTDLFARICHRFKNFCDTHDAKPVLVMMPQLMDLMRIKDENHYYKDLLTKLSEDMTVIDLAPALLASGAPEDLYINDYYGGHLSELGNEVAAKTVAQACSDMQIHMRT